MISLEHPMTVIRKADVLFQLIDEEMNKEIDKPQRD